MHHGHRGRPNRGRVLRYVLPLIVRRRRRCRARHVVQDRAVLNARRCNEGSRARGRRWIWRVHIDGVNGLRGCHRVREARSGTWCCVRVAWVRIVGHSIWSNVRVRQSRCDFPLLATLCVDVLETDPLRIRLPSCTVVATQVQQRSPAPVAGQQNAESLCGVGEKWQASRQRSQRSLA